MRELREMPSGIMSSKARGRLFSNGTERREQGYRSSRAAPQFAAAFGGGSLLAARRGVETDGPAGAAEGGTGAAGGDAGGADTFAGEVGAVAGEADVAAGATGGVADGGEEAPARGERIAAGSGVRV